MSDAKHTPGPWRTEWGFIGATRRLFVAIPGQDGMLVKNEADADLIASAPDLLAERDQLRVRAAELEAKVAELRGYTEHRPSCDALKMFADDPDNDEWKPTCTCGLTALLQRPDEPNPR